MNIQGIHLETAGSSGTPVLMLHGIGGSSASFAPQLDTIAREHQALAWDAPGYGASADPEAGPGMRGYTAAVVEILAEHGPAHLVGVSWGGVIATRVAAEYPDSVRSLALADSTRGSGRNVDGAAKMRERVAELRELGSQVFAEVRGPRLLSPGADPKVAEQVVRTMTAVRLPGYAFAAEAMAEADHSGVLTRIAVPTLVVVGEQDRVAGVVESRVLADGIPGSQLEIIPGAGHAANQERPEEFNRALLDFLDHVEAAATVGGLR